MFPEELLDNARALLLSSSESCCQEVLHIQLASTFLEPSPSVSPLALAPAQCASAVDNLAAYYFMHITAAVPSEDGPPPDAALKMAQHLRDCPTLFPEVSTGQTPVVLHL